MNCYSSRDGEGKPIEKEVKQLFPKKCLRVRANINTILLHYHNLHFHLIYHPCY